MAAKAATFPGGVIFDSAGNLYGTTFDGGGAGCDDAGCGTVFELTPSGEGKWTMTVLHSFRPKAKDGSGPKASLTMDAAGNIYGTTQFGGRYGYGTVFELIPGAGGVWTEAVLHNFNNTGKDGYFPVGNLIFNASGNLYGTASQGGVYGLGVVFELSPAKNGKWKEKVLHSFGNGTDGAGALAGLGFDTAGNLYGTTQYGGSAEAGTVFRLAPGANGKRTEKILYDFKLNGKDGTGPQGGVVFDTVGNLYSTTTYGGTSTQCSGGCGTVFELVPGANDTWTETVLHIFGLVGTDGALPLVGLVLDATGNLYGTTLEGGEGVSGPGTIFEMIPGTGGQWSETVVFSFASNGAKDGTYPSAELILDNTGRMYGTAQGGGSLSDCSGLGCGTVFRFTP
jgi:uncharacterized repeat protein (TIGR03803 family)